MSIDDSDFPVGSPEHDSALAAEYVLGLLDPEEVTDFAARLLAEPQLRDSVSRWQGRFAAGLADDIKPITPPARLKKAIDAKLFPDAPGKIGWKWWALGGVLSVLALTAFLGRDFYLPKPLGPGLTSEMVAEQLPLRVLALYQPETRNLIVNVAEGGAADGRDLELWWIASAEAAPVSLGVIPRNGQANINVPVPLASGYAGATLAITDEPQGGSATGAPTGPVLVSGPLNET